MRREKKGSKSGELSPKKDIVQEKKGNYKSRYQGELSPKKDIVEEMYNPSYKSRYN